MKVVSAFDGISCGMLALERAGIPVDRYVAFEIDKNAIKISRSNYPQIEQRGDITVANFSEFKGWDLLIGGSPCQSLSIAQAQHRTNLNGKSKLFFEFVRAKEEIKPKWFLFENVASMTEESRDTISKLLGCEPVLINSNRFSAQDRPRLYWTNIPVNAEGLQESGLTIADILETEVAEKYYYDGRLYDLDENKKVCCKLGLWPYEMMNRVYNPKFKAPTLTCVTGGHQQKKVLDNGRARKFTPLEYERLQTLPDNYTACASDTARYTAVGNGWTINVIAYIFSGLKKELE